MSLKYGAERRRCPERSDVLEAIPLQSRNVPCEVKDHEGYPCKGHDRTASGMTERLGAMDKPGACEWRAGEQPHSKLHVLVSYRSLPCYTSFTEFDLK